ncbi:hypothetical protein HY358_00925 [Candidatus Roizmanbacteria bacterium]|nr:hypothetical protein [Candidatus Roizmanbacteria bacterium]
MNQKELLVLAIVVFFTIIAWMLIDIYLVRNKNIVEREPRVPKVVEFKYDDSVFKLLQEKKP